MERTNRLHKPTKNSGGKNMKKILLSLTALLVLTSIQARDMSDYNYIVTPKVTYYCASINVGKLETKCVLTSGEILSLHNDEILAYKLDGRIFERMPVYDKDKDTGREVFMELIAIKGDHKLFKMHCSNGCFTVKRSCEKEMGYCRLYVFRSGNYHLEITTNNYPTVLQFFDIKTA